MESKKKSCKNCGKDISCKQHGRKKKHEYKYCSYACYYDARYGKVVRSTNKKLSTRNPLYLAAAELMKAGYTQREAAERMGINKNALRDWLYGRRSTNAAQISSNRNCRYCGGSLGEKPRLSRQYCSRSCSDKSRYHEKNPGSGSRENYESSVLSEAMEMYWSGIGGRAIAYHFGIAEGTVYSWIHDYGGERERCAAFTPQHLTPFKQRIHESVTTVEWLSALRAKVPEHTAQNEEPPVRLVCRTIDGRTATNGLVTLITEHLKCAPFSGETFAFCNKSYSIVSMITWQETMFVTNRFHKINGSFIWPSEKLGQSIEVAAHEFEYIVSFCKTSKKIGINT